MREESEKTAEGAALWRRARKAWRPVIDDAAPDPLLLAAYLDGELAEDEAARLEARLAAEPALLDEVMLLRAGLAEGAGTVPAAVVARAQGIYPEAPALRAVTGEKPGLLDRLFGLSLRPAVSAFAAVALLVACAGAFELGRSQATQMTTMQTAETMDSDVPVEFVMGGLL